MTDEPRTEQLSLIPEPPEPERARPEPIEPPLGLRTWYGRLNRRTRIGLWGALVAWLVIGLLAFGGWERIRRATFPDKPKPKPEPELVLLVAGSEQPAMALVHKRDVVLLPSGTVVELPGVGPEPLTNALAVQGPGGLATALANALGVKVPRTLVGDSGDVRALVDTLGGVQVNVAQTIQSDEGGVRRTIFSKGKTTLRGEDFVRFLTLPVPGQSELDRVARQSAAWRGLVARFGAKGHGVEAERVLDAWDGDLSGPAVRRILTRLAADRSAAYLTLPVERVGVSQADQYSIDRKALGEIRKRLAEVVAVPSTEGRRVRLLVGADGAVGPAAARALIEAGFVIRLTGRASQPYDVTRIVVAEDTDELRQAARRIRDVLGAGRLGLSKAPQSLVDVTLVIGRDWAAAHGFPQSPPPSPSPARRR